MLNDKIKPAKEAYFTALQNMFTQSMENLTNQRMRVLANIQTEVIDRIVDQITQENAWLQWQVADLSREIRSTVAARAALIWYSPMTTTPDSRSR